MRLLISLLIIVTTQGPSGWGLFAETRFQWEWTEDLGAEVEVPIFNKEVTDREGTEVILTGHYLPFELEGERIILSKLPYASCFFCGGDAGPGSVAEVVFKDVQRPFRMDELLTVKGRLQLNSDDYDHMVFMLMDAKVIE